jgi:hypothetical protein
VNGTKVPHPQDVGFTPRYEWHGRERVIVWQHCGQDAGRTERWERGLDGVQRRVTRLACRACDLRWSSDGGGK